MVSHVTLSLCLLRRTIAASPDPLFPYLHPKTSFLSFSSLFLAQPLLSLPLNSSPQYFAPPFSSQLFGHLTNSVSLVPTIPTTHRRKTRNHGLKSNEHDNRRSPLRTKRENHQGLGGREFKSPIGIGVITSWIQRWYRPHVSFDCACPLLLSTFGLGWGLICVEPKTPLKERTMRYNAPGSVRSVSKKYPPLSLFPPSIPPLSLACPGVPPNPRSFVAYAWPTTEVHR